MYLEERPYPHASEAAGLQVTHELGRAVTVALQHRTLLTYVYGDSVPRHETRKPYLHPVRSLAGELVTLYRPHDHPWHTGLTMTIPEVGDANFWGGNTYVPGTGYTQLDNNGEIRHDSWLAVTATESSVCLDERLSWVDITGVTLLQESRRVEVRDVDTANGWYVIDFTSALTNVAGRSLALGSSATKGLEKMGYWGLHWRGPREFAPGRVRGADGSTDWQRMNGEPAEWLTYEGAHDGSGEKSTLLFLDLPREERYPTQWFVMADHFPSITASFVYDEPYDLTAGSTLVLRHAVLVADGVLDGDRLELAAKAARGAGAAA